MNVTTTAEPTVGFSPLVLNLAWPRVQKLIILAVLAFFSSIANCCFLAAFFVEDALKRMGYVFLACVGIADFLITGAVMPTVIVILVSGQWNTPAVCWALQFLTELSTYAYSTFFSLVALDTYMRQCRLEHEYERFMSMLPIQAIVIFVFLICILMAGIGVYLQLDYDYCQRAHSGNLLFRVCTDVIFHAIPGLFITFCFLSAAFCMRLRADADTQPRYSRSRRYRNNRSLDTLNTLAYVLYAGSWLPHLFLAYVNPDSSDRSYYYCVWLGIARPFLTSMLYGILESSFRHSFAYLFNYVCLRNTTRPRNTRYFISEDNYRPPEASVHILQAGIRNSPQRARAGTSRDPQDL